MPIFISYPVLVKIRDSTKYFYAKRVYQNGIIAYSRNGRNTKFAIKNLFREIAPFRWISSQNWPNHAILAPNKLASHITRVLMAERNYSYLTRVMLVEYILSAGIYTSFKFIAEKGRGVGGISGFYILCDFRFNKKWCEVLRT